MPATEQSSTAERTKPDNKKPRIKKEKQEAATVSHVESKVSDAGHRSTVSDYSFVTEIQSMMYGFGDCRRPLVESAQIVEAVVHQQLNSILLQTSDFAASRGSKVIGPEDILFLFRKDKGKLSRLFHYLEIKDMKLSFKGVDESEDVSDTTGRGKRLRVCQDFLSHFDQTGELTALLSDNDLYDEVKAARELRAEQISRCLDQAQYLEYCEARRASFARKMRATRFKDWLMKDNLTELKPSGLALELFQYVAYETVAQIVDLALLVRNDSSRTGDPVTQGLAPLAVNPNFPSVHLTSFPVQRIMGSGSTSGAPPVQPSPPQGSLSPSSPSSISGSASSSGLSLHSPPGKARPKKKMKTQGDVKCTLNPSFGRILPWEIREALHLYWRPAGPFHFFTSLPHKTMGTRLLSC